MFSSRVPKLFGATLMEIAEAMLRPAADDGFAHADEHQLEDGIDARATRVTPAHPTRRRSRPPARDDLWLTEPLFAAEPSTASHPHRRAARIERRRRPGTIARPQQACTSPVSAPTSSSSAFSAHRAR
jgi:hypothetical protein